jgi:hypothetical protein
MVWMLEPGTRSWFPRAGVFGVFVGVLTCLIALSTSAGARGSVVRVPLLRPRFSALPYSNATTVGRYTIFDTGTTGSATVVFDEHTNAWTTVVLPSDCRAPLSAAIAGGLWLLEYCTKSTVDVYSLAANAWRTLAIPAVCLDTPGAECLPDTVGSDWIEYDESSVRLGDVFVFQNITTGQVRANPANARTVPDVNSPELAEHLCPPVRRPAKGTITPDGQFAIATGPTGTFLEHCGTSLHLVLDNSPFLTISARALFWLAGAHGPIDGMLLPSLRRFAIAGPPGDLISVSVSYQHLYVEASASPSSLTRVWSAPLPMAIR